MSIVLDGLTKRFERLVVVDDVHLEVAGGELFVLLGASGSGKSTVLRLIAGLTRPDRGRVVLDGRDVTALPPQKRGTGYVFQNYSIFRPMSVADNIEFGLKIRGVPAAERRRRREELLDLVDLGGLGDRYPDQISGGQQQRVALARALAYEPRVLLLDEPFGALDVKIRAQLRQSLKEIQKRLGVTTILVTHDQEEAFELADRVGVIERGRILEAGSAERLYERPRTYFVATFVGTGNVLVGREVEGRARFGDLSLPIPGEVPHEPGVRVQLMFRPEQVRLTPGRPEGDAPVLGRGEVLEQRFAGASLRLRVRLPRLARTRQISPPPEFGQEEFVIEALQSARDPISSASPWVSLSSWRILEQPPLSFLVWDAPEGEPEVLAVARELMTGIGAGATVLSVGRDPEASEAQRAALTGRLERAGLPGAETLVRFGKADVEISRRLGEALHDLVVVGAGERWGASPDRRNETVLALLDRAEAPLYVAKGAGARPLRNVLITTALGRPGKSNIRFGGRLARRAGARAVLFHALRDPGESPDRVTRYLERASATLRALEVPNAVRVRTGSPPVQAILEEARAGDYDLVVVGATAPRARSPFRADDVTLQVLAASERPVLVVPDEG